MKEKPKNNCHTAREEKWKKIPACLAATMKFEQLITEHMLQYAITFGTNITWDVRWATGGETSFQLIKLISL